VDAGHVGGKSPTRRRLRGRWREGVVLRFRLGDCWADAA
jgi:hypothetical protein